MRDITLPVLCRTRVNIGLYGICKLGLACRAYLQRCTAMEGTLPSCHDNMVALRAWCAKGWPGLVDSFAVVCRVIAGRCRAGEIIAPILQALETTHLTTLRQGIRRRIGFASEAEQDGRYSKRMVSRWFGRGQVLRHALEPPRA